MEQQQNVTENMKCCKVKGAVPKTPNLLTEHQAIADSWEEQEGQTVRSNDFDNNGLDSVSAAVDMPDRQKEDNVACAKQNMVEVGQTSSQIADVRGNCEEHVPEYWEDRVCVALAESAHCKGNHSRFRKDLVNLNKAVARWVKQEQFGNITRCELEDRIKNSPVVRSLRSSKGSEFQEDEFVVDLLSRAAKSIVETSA